MSQTNSSLNKLSKSIEKDVITTTSGTVHKHTLNSFGPTVCLKNSKEVQQDHHQQYLQQIFMLMLTIQHKSKAQANLQIYLNQIQKQLTTFKNQFTQLQQENLFIKQKLNQSENQKNSQKIVKEKIIQQLQSKINVLNQQLSNESMEVTRVRNEIQSMNQVQQLEIRNSDEAKIQANQFKQHFEQLNRKFESYQRQSEQQIRVLKDDILRKDNTISQLQATIRSLESKINLFKSRQIEMKQQYQYELGLVNSKNHTETRDKAINTNNEQYQKDKKEKLILVEQHTYLRKQFQIIKEELNKKNNQLFIVNKEYQESRKKYLEREQQFQQRDQRSRSNMNEVEVMLKDKVKEKDDIMKKAKMENQHLSMEINSMKSFIEEQKKQILNRDNQMYESSKSIAIFQEKQRNYQNQMHNIKEQLKRKSNEITNLNSKFGQNELIMNSNLAKVEGNLKQHLHEKDSSIKKLMVEKEHYNREINSLKSLIEEQKRTISDKDYEIKNLYENNRTMVVLEEKIKNYEHQLKQSKEEIERKNKQISTLNIRISQNQSVMGSNLAKVESNLKDRIQERQISLKKYTKQKDYYIMEINSLKALIEEQKKTIQIKDNEMKVLYEQTINQLNLKQTAIKRTQRFNKILEDNIKTYSHSSQGKFQSKRRNSNLNLEKIMDKVLQLQNSNQRSNKLIDRIPKQSQYYAHHK